MTTSSKYQEQHNLPDFMVNSTNENKNEEEMSNKNNNIHATQIHLDFPSLQNKYIIQINHAFSIKECQSLINFSNNIGYKTAIFNIGFGNQTTNIDFRKHQRLVIDNHQMAKYIFQRISHLIPQTFQGRKCIGLNERFRFLHYSNNEYFGAHYDSMFLRTENNERSLLTVLIYLNDIPVENGGQLKFLHPMNEKKYKCIQPECGMIVIFEQSELLHESTVLTNGEKYCIRTDVMYSGMVNDELQSKEVIGHSFEVEKQKLYFERKSFQKINGKRKKKKKNVVEIVVRHWFQIHCTNDSLHSCFFGINCEIFPSTILKIIRRYSFIVHINDYDWFCDDQQLLSLVRICETAERYEDMCTFITEYCYQRSDMNVRLQLDKDTRDLLSVAFKNIVGQLRASWRVLCHPTLEYTLKDLSIYSEHTFAKKPSMVDEKITVKISKKYSALVCKEIEDKCLECITLLERCLIPSCDQLLDCGEHYVYYHKMVADYYRYLCEIFTSDPMNEKYMKYLDMCAAEYETAYSTADQLRACHPTRLGCMLNYSVFLYEIVGDKSKACSIVKSGFDNAINELDGLSDDQYKDATLIMRLLRDNLTLWTSEENNNNNV